MNLEQQTREADMNLLNQYKKELDDLNKGIGLAKCMTLREIVETKALLTETINGYKGYLD